MTYLHSIFGAQKIAYDRLLKMKPSISPLFFFGFHKKNLWNDSALKIRKYKKEDDVNHNYVSSVENRKINLLITTT